MCHEHPCVTALLRLTIALLVLSSACGRQQDFDRGDELSPTILGGGGGGRSFGQGESSVESSTRSITTKTKQIIRRLKPRPTFDIVPVTQIVTATSGIEGWPNTELPFTGPPVSIGSNVSDGQTPIMFSFEYPENNFQLTEAHLVMDTSRDSSDTEGIFVDGVFSGRPPLSMVNSSSPHITHAVYFGSGASSINTYFIDWSVAHYKRLTRNSFDLLLADLLGSSPVTPIDTLRDGRLNVVAGDDSPIYQAFLIIKGLTTSSEGLACHNSENYTYTNVYLHNDGNTVGSTFFNGAVGSPYSSWSSQASYQSVEFYFDAPLPKVETEKISLTNAKLSIRARKNNSGAGAAIVINGVGVSTSGFNRSGATSAVETWNESGTTVWENFIAGVSTAGAGALIELDLLALLGSEQVRNLIAQGKLNISLTGDIYAHGQAPSANRQFGVAVSGPELKLDGTYYTEVCIVPNNPRSPLTEGGIVELPDEYEEIEIEVENTDESEEHRTVVENDGSGPIIGSLQVLEIQSTSATIVWSTDEPATSRVRYGISKNLNEEINRGTLTTFHQVKLSGLSPYKYYSFQVYSVDQYGNESSSEIEVFVTLR